MHRLRAGLVSLRSSPTALRSVKNATFSSGDYVVLALLSLAATPIFIARLGVDAYGVWMLANSILGISGVLGFGVAEATIRFVVKYRNANDDDGVARVIRSTFTLYLALGMVAGVVGFALAPTLVHTVFRIDSDEIALAILAFRIVSVTIVARFADSVLHAALQGFERYDITAKTSIITNMGSTIGMVVAAIAGWALPALMLIQIGASVLGGIAKAIILKRRLAPGLSLAPNIDVPAIREVLGFGVFSWVQVMSGTVFNQIDRLLVASLLGTTALTYYSVCLNLAQQVPNSLAKTAGFVFPLAGSAAERGDVAQLRTIYTTATRLTISGGIALGAPLFILSQDILSLWIGPEFAAESAALLRLFIFSTTLLTTSIIPYYFMNATGLVHTNAAVAVANGALTSVAAFVLIRALGVFGGAWARISFVPVDVVARAILHARVLGHRNPLSTVAVYVPVLAAFGLAAAARLAMGSGGHGPVVTLLLAIVLALGFGAFGFGLSALVIRPLAPSAAAGEADAATRSPRR